MQTEVVGSPKKAFPSFEVEGGEGLVGKDKGKVAWSFLAECKEEEGSGKDSLFPSPCKPVWF